MLKRRPSKRFVLAETGEEGAWNTTTDNDGITGVTQPTPTPSQPIPHATPKIEIGLTPILSVSSMDEESPLKSPSTPNLQLLHVSSSRIK